VLFKHFLYLWYLRPPPPELTKRRNVKANKRKSVKRKTKPHQKWIGKGSGYTQIKMYKKNKSKSYDLSHLLLNISHTDIIFLIRYYKSSTALFPLPYGHYVTIDKLPQNLSDSENTQIGSIDDNGIIKIYSDYYIIPEQIVKTKLLQTIGNVIHINLTTITPEQKIQIENLNTSKGSNSSN